MDEHVIEALGKARVVVRDGKVVEVGDPQISYCPIFDKNKGIKTIDKEAIAKNIQSRIDSFGMCTARRALKMTDFVSFGVSEIVSTGVNKGLLDAAVLVCEGCGTLVVTDPEMVQGIGGRVSGLVSTTPIPELIERVGRDKVLDPATAKIDQVAGVRKAIAMGFRNIAVSVTSGSAAKALRELEREAGVNVYVFVVHATGISKDEARLAYESADVTTGCASKFLRESGSTGGFFKVGNSVPIFGVTQRGVALIQERVKVIGKPLVLNPAAPQPDRLL
jgi:putative methanogenesis marker protein 8